MNWAAIFKAVLVMVALFGSIAVYTGVLVLVARSDRS
jgi:hypothetical protein